jgi:peptidoglycan pentaglycine glycine transferase (the first glycine)
MPELTLDQWNALLHEYPNAHLLQTGAWGELKSSFGWEPVRIVGQALGVQILFRHLPLGYSFAYIPKGPVVWGINSDIDYQFWDDVDASCRKRRAIFLKMEMDGWEEEGHPIIPYPATYHTSPLHVQPRSTLVIDLHRSQDEIFDCMKPKTRYNIRLAGRKEVTVSTSEDVESFHRLMTVTSRREAFHVHSLEYYRKAYDLFHPQGQCELFFARYQDKTLAGLMVFAAGQTAYYFYGASADEERNRKPTYPLQWEAICWAKRMGCTQYDMWGIPDEALGVPEEDLAEREDGLWGVYRFKRGFGGSVKCAIQTLDRVYNPLLYKLYVWRFSTSGSD